MFFVKEFVSETYHIDHCTSADNSRTGRLDCPLQKIALILLVKVILSLFAKHNVLDNHLSEFDFSMESHPLAV